MPLTIVQVHAQDGLAEFVEFPWAVYGDDPAWVPPLRQQVFYELSDAGTFAQYGRRQLYLCEVDGTPAGRIAASLNPRLLDRSGTPIGQLGFFECVDDAGVAAALVEAGVAWLRAQGASQIVGPMNGGAHRLHRLMTRGFDRDPFLFEPRNPPYYPALFERCGFTPILRWFGYEFDPPHAERLVSQYDRILARRPLHGELIEPPIDRTEEIILRVHRLLDGCWEGHDGYASLDLPEFAEVFQAALSIMQTGNLSLLVRDGRDVGFSLSYPDYAAEMRELRGDATGWGRWLGAKRPERVVLHTTALLAEARSGSSALAQVAWLIRGGLKAGVDRFVVAPTIEGYCSTIGEQTRDYALYSYSRQ